MYRKIDLKFFDEEPDPQQTAAPAAATQEPAPSAEPAPASQPNYNDMSEEDFARQVANVRLGNMNDDSTPEPAAEPKTDESKPAAGVPQQTEPAKTEPAEPEPQQQPQAPNYGKYADLINSLETDGAFRQALVDAMIARRNGAAAPTVMPQAQQQAQKTDEDAEPEQGEDELLEDFERRHDEWKSRQEEKKVRSILDKALSENRMVYQQEMIQRQKADVINLLQQDPEGPAVSQFYQQNPMPKALSNLMEQDPNVFMYIYDGMRQLSGKGNYFAEVFAARRKGIPYQPQQAQAQQQTAPVPARQQTPAAPAARTVVKAPKAPYTEGAGGSNGKGGTSGLDFINMSEKDFAAYKNKVLMQGI